mmetsp:Transcript_28296/g.84727  ORF Transcript_28296/g.84727 Transcript_28296/m.84727 type:complete len:444 (+) Transcript_28296:227-1558(+)
MRLPEDIWVRTLGFSVAKDAARVERTSPAQRTAVSRAVSLALGRRGSTRDLRDAELRSRGCARVAQTGEEKRYVVTGNGSLLEYGAVTALPRRLPVGGLRVASVSAGMKCAAAVTETGQLWTCGEGLWGALGLGDRLRRDQPCRVEALADCFVTNVSCGYDFCWAVDRNGAAFYWGNVEDMLESRDDLVSDELRMQLMPKRVNTRGKSIVSACAGFYTGILVTADGQLLGCGKNECGELGVGDTLPRIDELVRLGGDALAGERIVKASTTNLARDEEVHTLVLTSSGVVYGFGAGDCGQLANDVMDPGVPVTVVIPRVIPTLAQFDTATDVLAVGGKSFVVTGGNELWSFGFTSLDYTRWSPRPSLAMSRAWTRNSKMLSFCAASHPGGNGGDHLLVLFARRGSDDEVLWSRSADDPDDAAEALVPTGLEEGTRDRRRYPWDP